MFLSLFVRNKLVQYICQCSIIMFSMMMSVSVNVTELIIVTDGEEVATLTLVSAFSFPDILT